MRTTYRCLVLLTSTTLLAAAGCDSLDVPLPEEAISGQPEPDPVETAVAALTTDSPCATLPPDKATGAGPVGTFAWESVGSYHKYRCENWLLDMQRYGSIANISFFAEMAPGQELPSSEADCLASYIGAASFAYQGSTATLKMADGIARGSWSAGYCSIPRMALGSLHNTSHTKYRVAAKVKVVIRGVQRYAAVVGGHTVSW